MFVVIIQFPIQYDRNISFYYSNSPSSEWTRAISVGNFNLNTFKAWRFSLAHKSRIGCLRMTWDETSILYNDVIFSSFELNWILQMTVSVYRQYFTLKSFFSVRRTKWANLIIPLHCRECFHISFGNYVVLVRRDELNLCEGFSACRKIDI